MPRSKQGRRSSKRQPTRIQRNSAVAHFSRQCRLGSGNLVVNASGAVTPTTGLGGFADSSTGMFLFTPPNLGIAIDIANYFSMWRLNKLLIHYVSDMRIMSTSSTALVPGVAMFAVIDDPGRLPASTPTTGQLVESRSFKEVPLDRNFTLNCTPIGNQARWLQCSVGTTTDSSTLRQACAGAVTFTQSINGSLISGTIGRLYVEFDISFKGSAIGQTPTVEEKSVPARLGPLQEQKRDDSFVTAASETPWSMVDDEDDYSGYLVWKKQQAKLATKTPQVGAGTKGLQARIGPGLSLEAV